MFGLHPALLDATLHTVGLGGLLADTGQSRLPFAWSGVSLYAAGAAELRVRLTARGADAVSLAVADGSGSPVALVDSLVLRPFSPEQLAGSGGRHESLFSPEWTGVALPAAGSLGTVAVLGEDALGLAGAECFEDLATLGEIVPDTVVVPLVSLPPTAASDVATATHQAVHRALALVQEWLTLEALDSYRLVVVTRGAGPAVLPGEDVHDLAAAAVRGLLRSAQSEKPGRIVLVDLDQDPASTPPWLRLLVRVSRRWRCARGRRSRRAWCGCRWLWGSSCPRWIRRGRCCSRVPVVRWVAWWPGIWWGSTALGVCCWCRVGAVRLVGWTSWLRSQRPGGGGGGRGV